MNVIRKQSIKILMPALFFLSVVVRAEEQTVPTPAVQGAGYMHLYYGNQLLQANGTFSVSPWSGSSRQPLDEDLGDGSAKALGLTFGIWVMDSVPSYGGAFDLAYLSYDSESGNVGFDALTLSLMFNVQAPLFKTENLPRGRIRPYAGIGPSFLLGDLDATIHYTDGSTAEGDEAVWGFGLDMRAGLEVMITRSFGFYAEYRYFLFSVESDKDDFVFFDVPEYNTIGMDMQMGMAMVGMTLTY